MADIICEQPLRTGGHEKQGIVAGILGIATKRLSFATKNCSMDEGFVRVKKECFVIRLRKKVAKNARYIKWRHMLDKISGS